MSADDHADADAVNGAADGSAATPVEFDPFGADVLADPFPAYSELRERCPVHRFDGFEPPFYTVTRHEDVSAMLRDWETWSSHYGQSPRYTVTGCLFSDPPAHTAYRKLVQQGFAPRVVERLLPDIERLADELIDGLVAGGSSGDLHDAVACPLPVLVIAHVLGVPTSEIAQFKAWSDKQVEAMNSSDPDAARENRAQLDAFFLDQLELRRGLLRRAGLDPATARQEALGDVVPDDVISGLLLAETDTDVDATGRRRLIDDELLNILQQLLVGGNETTTSLITNLFRRLLEQPELYRQVVASPDLDAVAVEESLRLDAPVLGLFRTPTRDVELHGVTIPERTKVMATYGAANRDPAVFDDPDTFRLDRDVDELRRQHLAFGLGRHFCPGAHLSRLEARIVLRKVADRLPDLRLAGDHTRIPTFLLWGRRTLPVTWTNPLTFA